MTSDSEQAVFCCIELNDAAGRKQKLKLVATLKGSIFQSEMLMGESNFLKLFPAQAGYQTVLVETSPENQDAVAKLLSNELEEYSVAVDTTAARLHAYHQVANTYLSTFRVLGSLGLMLGTIGLAVVLVRNLVERRAELALGEEGVGAARGEGGGVSLTDLILRRHFPTSVWC